MKPTVILLFAVALVAYKAFFAPPILTIGMPKDEAIAALRRANADDMLRLSSTAVFIPAGSKIKINKPSAKDIVEYQRFASVLETKVTQKKPIGFCLPSGDLKLTSQKAQVNHGTVRPPNGGAAG